MMDAKAGAVHCGPHRFCDRTNDGILRTPAIEGLPSTILLCVQNTMHHGRLNLLINLATVDRVPLNSANPHGTVMRSIPTRARRTRCMRMLIPEARRCAIKSSQTCTL